MRICTTECKMMNVCKFNYFCKIFKIDLSVVMLTYGPPRTTPWQNICTQRVQSCQNNAFLFVQVSNTLLFFAVCEEKNPEELRILLQVFHASLRCVLLKWNCYIQNDVIGRSRPGSWSVLGMAGTVCITCLFGACCHPQSFYSNTRTRRLFLKFILWHTVYAQNYCQF